jgi:calcineurin-like phosphoesterase family protein
MRTLVISDLHLGSRGRYDVLRGERARAVLGERLAGVDRLVVLGDLLELRHGPQRDAIAVAKPVLQAIGAALGPEGEVIVVPGNHDHTLVSGWLDGRLAQDASQPLELEQRMAPWGASAAGAMIAAALAPAHCEFAYPGIWLRDDVYATHGHYFDLHTTVPTIERLAAGAMARLAGRLPDGPCGPDDYERILAPLYAWNHAAAQRLGVAAGPPVGAGHSARIWNVLNGDGHRPVRARLLARAFPLGIAALNAAGVGPVKADVSTAEMRRAALTAIGSVVRRLGIDAEHVIFGHSHRAGPLPGDDATEWRVAGRVGEARLYNAGCWVYEDVFLARAGTSSPYWPGTAVSVEDAGPPRIERLLAGVPAGDLLKKPPAPA